MLSLAGASAYVWSLEDRHRGRGGDADRRRVVPPERARLPERRWRLRGRHRQPRADRRRHGGRRAAGRLRADRGGVDLVGRPERRVGDPGVLRARGGRGRDPGAGPDGDEPARRPGVGDAVRDPDLRLHDRHHRDGALRPAAGPDRRPAPGRERAPHHHARARLRGRADQHRADRAAGPRVLVRLRRAHRRRGDLQRRPGVPQAEEPQRRHHAAPPRHHRDHHAAEHHRAGPEHGAAVRRPERRRPAAHRRRPGAAGRLRPAHGHRAAVQGDLHRLPAGLLLRGGDDRDHPGARGEHGVQRLPGARLDPGPRRVRAPRAGLARRPAGLQQRHRLPGRDGDHPDPGLQRRDEPADPALHRGGLRLVQPEPARA